MSLIMVKLECSHKQDNMLQNKSTKVLSELKDFFSSTDKAVNTALSVYNGLHIESLSLSLADLKQSKYQKRDLLLLLLLFPLFGVENVRGYFASILSKQMEACSDTFYRFKNNPMINWRSLVYGLNKRILKRVEADPELNKSPACLILDDTDLRKKGKFIEHIGYVWSHVWRSFVLGYKGLFLGYWDGKIFTCLDFSLHKEAGKNSERMFGLTNKERRVQYKKQRETISPGYKREQEVLISKIQSAINMVKEAVQRGIPFEYVLMDSWFVCKEIMKVALKANRHLLGMVKKGKTKYNYQGNNLTVNQIHNRLNRNKKYTRSRKLGMFVSYADASLEGIGVRLFFYKGGRRSGVSVILSTDTSLTAYKVYEIYAIRWSIEVFFKESRNHFNLGKSQSEDFDGQIADISLSIIQYNIFSIAKRVAAYETLGYLFKDIENQIMEKTMAERIWGLILELINLISDLLEVDVQDLLFKIFHNESNQGKIGKILAIYRANAA